MGNPVCGCGYVMDRTRGIAPRDWRCPACGAVGIDEAARKTAEDRTMTEAELWAMEEARAAFLSKMAANLSVGNRESPLEADVVADVDRDDRAVGDEVEVSTLAAGDFVDLIGKGGRIRGVIRRLGVIVGYEVEVEGKTLIATPKDLFIRRQLVEDIGLVTPTSRSLVEALSHWKIQRDYWVSDLSGLEAMCFEVASVTRAARIVVTDYGWRFEVPEPTGGMSVVDVAVRPHGNVWSATVAVYAEPRWPYGKVSLVTVIDADDHWERTFRWAIEIARKSRLLPWVEAASSLAQRAKDSMEILRPVVARTVAKVLAAAGKTVDDVGRVSVGFSKIRLPPSTVGLTEPPTDRRAYSVISVSPDATRDLSQIVLHEIIHLAVAVRGGEPHNEDFEALAEKLGLEEKHRA